jgi:AMMECR1 domain-containing protein
VSDQTFFLFPGDFNVDDELSIEECSLLLGLARQALEQAVGGKPLVPLDIDELPSRLKEQGATFVTLTRGGSARIRLFLYRGSSESTASGY